MYEARLIEKGEYLTTLKIDRYICHENFIELIFPNAERIKIVPLERIYALSFYPIPTEQEAEG